MSDLSTAALNILFRDEFLIAVDKPTGWDVHRNAHNRNRPVVMTELRRILGANIYPVHRLDGATSGVLLFALDKCAQREINRQFQSRYVSKTYHAIVRGFLIDCICNDPLEVEGALCEAETKFKSIDQIELPWPNRIHATSRYSFIEVIPVTGRFHQIRRHLNHLGWPIIGDTAHGDGFHNRLWRENFSCHRLLLHASSIQLLHPNGGEIKIGAPLPDIFQKAFVSLGRGVLGDQ